jgi:hypothetical protein
MHHIPAHRPNINIASYPDDIAITSTHTNANMLSTEVQPYLNTLQSWFTTKRLQIVPAKSTTTLLTNYTKEHQHVPHVTLNNNTIHQKHNIKILGVTYDISISFKDQDIKCRCTPRLNTIKALKGIDFGQHKETTTPIYKQYI